MMFLPTCSVSKHTLPHSTAAGLDWEEAHGVSLPLCLLNSSSTGVAKSLIWTKSVALSSSLRRSESKDITSFSRVFQFSLTWTPFPEFFWSPPPVFPPRELSWFSHWTQSANTGGTSKPTAQHRINTENRKKYKWEQDKPSNEGRQEKRGQWFRRNDGKELREKNGGRKRRKSHSQCMEHKSCSQVTSIKWQWHLPVLSLDVGLEAFHNDGNDFWGKIPQGERRHREKGKVNRALNEEST